MLPAQQPRAHLLLGCLFASFQQVSPKICGISLCGGDRCCSGQCCRLYPGSQEETSNVFGLLLIIVGVLMGAGCLFAACKCCTNHSAQHLREAEALAWARPPPAPPTPRSPEPPEDPPPYSEVGLPGHRALQVASKPGLYPPPVIPPPSYSDVIAAGPPSTGLAHQTTL